MTERKRTPRSPPPPGFVEIVGSTAAHIALPATHALVERLQVQSKSIYSLAYNDPPLPDGGPSTYSRSVFAWGGTTENLLATYTGPNLEVTSFAVTPDRLYLNSGDVLERYTCLKAHCTTFTTLKFGSYTTCRLATDGVRLFWLATDGLQWTRPMRAMCGAS